MFWKERKGSCDGCVQAFPASRFENFTPQHTQKSRVAINRYLDLFPSFFFFLHSSQFIFNSCTEAASVVNAHFADRARARAIAGHLPCLVFSRAQTYSSLILCTDSNFSISVLQLGHPLKTRCFQYQDVLLPSFRAHVSLEEGSGRRRWSVYLAFKAFQS